METIKPQIVYIVQAFHWQYNDNWNDINGETPLRAFLDREDAEAFREECEEITQRENFTDFNPARFFGGLERMTTLPTEELMERYGIIGLPMPELVLRNEKWYPDFYNEEWWRAIQKTEDQERLGEMWRLFDLARFYEVVEVEVMK